MKFLIDECLHTSLVDVAHTAGYVADHVAHRGLAGRKDRELMEVVLGQDYTFVTNNRSDFLALYQREALHAGLIVIVPNVAPKRQCDLFHAVLQHIGEREIVNTVIEVCLQEAILLCREYTMPSLA